ncbi:MAG: rhodanese-like domain-containing protein [Smithellaceae bacterium]|nr:rhodanese-like domain-containing protein [Smithellaceae bacterium]
MTTDGKGALVDKLRKAIRQSAVLIALALLLGVASQSIRADAIPWLGKWDTSPSAGSSTAYPGVSTISLQEAWKLYRAGKVCFLDARDSWSYNDGHLPGALHIPPAEAAKKAAEVKALAAGGKTLISYCDGATCPLGEQLASALRKEGVVSVRVLKNGWTLWQETGYPTERQKR